VIERQLARCQPAMATAAGALKNGPKAVSSADSELSAPNWLGDRTGRHRAARRHIDGVVESLGGNRVAGVASRLWQVAHDGLRWSDRLTSP